MPKFNNVRSAIKECSSPMILFLTKGEVASSNTTLRAFTNGDITIVSNGTKLFNPVDGQPLQMIEKSSHEITGEAFNQLAELVTLTNDENEIAGFDPDLAFALSNEEMFSPKTGKVTTYYSETAGDDDSEDDSDDESSDDDEFETIVDTDDDAAASDDTNDDESSDDTSGDDIDSVEDVVSDDSVDDTSTDDSSDEDIGTDNDDDTSDEDEDDKSSDDDSEEAKAAKLAKDAADATAAAAAAKTTEKASDENPELKTEALEAVDAVDKVEEVEAIQLADADANVTLVALNKDATDVAAFVGTTHVGTLRRVKASETAAHLYNDGSKLASAFKPVFKKHRADINHKELASFGFEPVKFTVSVGDLFSKRLERETAKVAETAAAETASHLDDMAKTVELAFVGLNKGVFKGDNDLAIEIAALLQRNGVKNAGLEARKLLAKSSHKFIASGIAKAKELSLQSKDYLRGITETIATAAFIGGDIDQEVQTPVKQPTKTKEVASSDGFVPLHKPETKSNTNRFSGLVSGLGRR